jgi:HAD superfamily hydrolase (TIGR01509 family)
MKYKALLFDFNGVLWWDSAIQEEAWNRMALALRGERFSAEEFGTHVHGRNNSYTLSFLTGRKLNAEEIEGLAEQKEEFYRALCLAQGENFRLSPGAKELLDWLRQNNVPRTIATASGRKNVDFFVKELELARWFDPELFVLDDGTLPGKPAPDIYLRAASKVAVPPGQCVVVEDARSGIAAASAAGIGHIIALGPAAKHPELRKLAGVSETVTSLAEVRKEIFASGPNASISYDLEP